MSHDFSGRLYLRQLHRAAVLSDQSSTATAKAGDTKAGAEASKLTASSSPADAEHFCRCSARKDARFLVCRSCWWQVPEAVRKDFRFGDAREKRNAMRILLEFASGRKAMRSLQTATTEASRQQRALQPATTEASQQQRPTTSPAQ
jgi:hypothetical protein